MSSSSRARDPQSDSNIVDTNIISAPDNSSNPESAQNTRNVTEQSSQVEFSNTEFPQPAIIRPQSQDDNNNNSSIVHILEETPPPPYHTDPNIQNIQIPIPSHSRNHTTITLSSPPEYTQTITTQPQAMPQPSHQRSLSDITNEGDALLATQELKFCKICQESDEPSTAQDEVEGPYRKGKLISPCKCKGSLQYVHIGCLNQWRNSNVRQEASYRCEVCKYEYKFYRPRLARIFSSSLTLHFLTLVLLFSVIYLFAYIVKLVNTNDVPYNPNDPTAPPPLPPPPYKRRWKDIQLLNLRMIDWVIGTSLVSLLGLIFFVTLICLNGVSHTRSNFCYCGGCPFWYGYGGGFGSDCSNMGGDCGGVFIIVILLILVAMFTIGFFGAIIAAYLFIQKITETCLERVHDHILEVKKD